MRKNINFQTNSVWAWEKLKFLIIYLYSHVFQRTIKVRVDVPLIGIPALIGHLSVFSKLKFNGISNKKFDYILIVLRKFLTIG